MRHAHELVGWYEQIAASVDRPHRQASASRLDPPAVTRLDDIEEAASQRCVSLIWVDQHLQHLAQHAPGLVDPATHVAEQRRTAWWR
jgi:hypothetical protein